MGFIEDNIQIWVSVFVFAILLIIGAFIFFTLDANPILNPYTQKLNMLNNWISLDYISLVAMLGMTMAAVILAYFIPSHPAFFFSYFLLIVMALVITPALTHAYYLISLDASLGPMVQYFPITGFMISNLPVIALFIVGLVAVVSYAKPYGNRRLGDI